MVEGTHFSSGASPHILTLNYPKFAWVIKPLKSGVGVFAIKPVLALFPRLALMNHWTIINHIFVEVRLPPKVLEPVSIETGCPIMLLLYPGAPTGLEPKHGKTEGLKVLLIILKFPIEIRVLLNRVLERHIYR